MLTKNDCIKWLKNPKLHPKTNKNIINDKDEFIDLIKSTIYLLKPQEIYNLNSNIFEIIGYDKYYNIE